MIHPTNPNAVRVKRDGERGWHWVGAFDPAVHQLFAEKPASASAPADEPAKTATPPAKRKAKGKK